MVVWLGEGWLNLLHPLAEEQSFEHFVLNKKNINQRGANESKDLAAEDEDVESMWGGQEKVDKLDNSSSQPCVGVVVVVGDEGGEPLVDVEDKVGRRADDEDKDQPDQYVNHGSIPDSNNGFHLPKKV